MSVRKYITPFLKQAECAAAMEPSFRLIGGDVIELAGTVNEKRRVCVPAPVEFTNQHKHFTTLSHTHTHPYTHTRSDGWSGFWCGNVLSSLTRKLKSIQSKFTKQPTQRRQIMGTSFSLFVLNVSIAL